MFHVHERVNEWFLCRGGVAAFNGVRHGTRRPVSQENRARAGGQQTGGVRDHSAQDHVHLRLGG